MNTFEFTFPDYEPDRPVPLEWDEGSEAMVRIEGDVVVLKANPAGLQSLARHLLTLAQEGVPEDTRITLNSFNGLTNNSYEVVVERM